MTMKKAMTAVVGCALLLAAGLGVWLGFGGDGDVAVPERDMVVGSAAEDAAPNAAGSERNPVPATAPAIPRGVRSGTLVYSDGLPAADVPFWTWGEVRPFWTRVPEEPRDMSAMEELGEPAGSTGWDGEWRLPAEPIEAVTFAPFEGTFVSYELESFEGEPAFELPPFTEINLMVEGAGEDDLWRASLASQVARGSGRHQSWRHEFPSGVAAVSLVRQALELRGHDTASFPAISGLPYEWSAAGRGFGLDPEAEDVLAPVSERLEIVRRSPVVDVVVLESGGVLPAPVDGWIVMWSEDEVEKSRSQRLLEDGRGLLGWRRFEPGTRYFLRAVLEDGEQFAGQFRFDPDQTSKEIRFVRGEGLLPSLTVQLPEGAELDGCQVILEDARGRTSYGEHVSEQSFWFDVISADTTFAEGGAGTLLLSNLPEGWHRLWIFTRSGRAVTLANPGPGQTVRVPWMPDTELDEVDLGGLYSSGQLAQGADVVFQIELHLSSGRSTWLTIEHFATYHDTYRFPVWHKWAPLGLDYQIIGWGAGSPRVELKPPRKRDG